MWRVVSGIIMTLLLTGCASMSEDECRQADWREVGYSDAAKGQNPARIADHREACAKANVRVDHAEYLAGFEAGLSLYCTPTTAFESAMRGRAYAVQCEQERFPSYADAFTVGQDAHQLSQQHAELSQSLQKTRQQMDTLISQIANEDNRLRAEDLSRRERDQIKRSIWNLRGIHDDQTRQAARIEQQMGQLEQEIQALRAGVYQPD